MSGTLHVYTLDRRPDLKEQREALNEAAWPEFLLHGDLPGWGLLFRRFARYQLLICDDADRLIAFGHTVPFCWDGTGKDLPETMAEIIARAVEAEDANRRPNTFSALAAVVNQGQQGRGLSTRVLEEMRRLAGGYGATSLVAPVRPTWKSRYPLIPMAEYVTWTRPDGALFDPWLRIHARLGATIERIAPSTLRVEGTVAEWEAWTGMAFPGSGEHIVPGALEPVLIHRAQDLGTYDDPNVWMRHPVDPKAIV